MEKVTKFAQSVYDATCKIPKGKVTTYKLIALAIQNPRAIQAVGNALSVNPFAPNVPCHRVIASDGTLGGYFGDSATEKESDKIKLKISLLKNEGVIINENGKISDEFIFKDF